MILFFKNGLTDGNQVNDLEKRASWITQVGPNSMKNVLVRGGLGEDTEEGEAEIGVVHPQAKGCLESP